MRRPRATIQYVWRRLLGAALIGSGTVLVVTTLLAAGGAVPLLQPSVPPPVALLEPSPTPLPPPVLERPAPLVDAATRPPAPRREPTVTPAPRLVPTAPTSVPPEMTATPEPLGWLAALGPRLPKPPTPSPTPTVPPSPTAVPPPPLPGQPLRLKIPTIGVDTAVVELDVIDDPDHGLVWETVPFVAGHYGITGLVGAPANVVISGHVTTRDQGNVFRDLYRVRPGSPVVVYTRQGEFTYRIADLRLVRPDEVEVLDWSPTPRLSLVTCAGTYDFRTRTFSHRLVVVGDLVS